MKVPKGWEDIDFGELAEFRNGLNYRGEQAGEGLAIVGVSDFGDRMFPDYSALSRVSGFDALPEDQLLNDGDLVFVRSNGNKALIGRSMLIVRPPERLGHSGFTIRARLKRERILPKFAAYFFRSYQARAQLDRLGGGTNISNLSQDILSAMQIALPPLGEQRRIAEILGAWDEAIEKVQALILAKQKLKRALMHQLLTPTRRFPQFNSQKLKLRPLGEFFRHFKEANGAADRVPLSCSKVHGIIPQSEKFAKRVASADLSRYQVVHRGDLVFDPMLLWDASISFVETVDEGVLSPAYSTFHFNEVAGDRTYFRELLKGHRMRHWYKVISRGTNKRRRKAMPEDFLEIPLPIPTMPEQQRIGELLGTINAEVKALTRLAKHLGTQKRGLMQKLLTGQVRVKEAHHD